MAFPNEKPFANPFIKSPSAMSQDPFEQNSASTSFSLFSSGVQSSTFPTSSGSFGTFQGGQFGSRSNAPLFGQPSFVPHSVDTVTSVTNSSTTGTGHLPGIFGVSVTAADSSSRSLFAAPSAMSSSSRRPFGVFQSSSGGFHDTGSSAQLPSFSNPSTISLFGSQTFGQTLFQFTPGVNTSASSTSASIATSLFGKPVMCASTSSTSESVAASLFGKPVKCTSTTSASEFVATNLFRKPVICETQEPQRHVLFGKVVPAETKLPESKPEQQRDAGTKLPYPDLMSLSPGRQVSSSKRASSGYSSDQDQIGGYKSPRGISPARDKSPKPLMSLVVNPLSGSSTQSELYKSRVDKTELTREPELRRRRLLSSDSDRSSLVVKGIPPEHNNQDTLMKHFSKFGPVTKITIMRKTNTAYIYFASHEAAEKAKERGRYLPGVDERLHVFMRQDLKRQPSNSSSAFQTKIKDSGEKLPSPSRVMPVRNVSEETEIEKELASMQGTEDVMNEIGQTSNSCSTILTAEFNIPETIPPQKKLKHQTAPPLASQGKAGSQTAHIEGEPSTVAALRPLVGSVGQTAGERFAILENRDKLIKAAMSTQKQSDLATAKAVKGTCQDMCPEKERYMREDRRRLNSYEIIPGTDQTSKLPQVDHSRAVKEYSRSSADQDMPLPQELRPPEVLSVTMNYLLTYIINTGGPGKWGEWYDFLWNRTRSIRKDITQQHLCDPIAVSLVEKCARFHIFCSEALCEEDAAVFDTKINNENLTKCLQTLKELYYDLHVRQDVTCLENEAEFCMYMVLMNLNKGDILREVQQLNVEVRESPWVKFSIRVYSALNSTNYIKFFKLVREASFLSACIMHRYFHQIRTSALQRMIKAYTQPGHCAVFRLGELSRQLGFETDEEVGNFCRHHGLSVENGVAMLEKSRFCDSEVFPIGRSKILVEGKQTLPLGEIINGGPLPPCIIKEPTSSFNENGLFIVASSDDETPALVAVPTASIGVTTASVVVTTANDNIMQETVPGLASIVNDSIVKECTRELILEVISEMCRSISHPFVNDIQSILNACDGISNELLNEAANEFIRSECQCVLKECIRESEEMKAAKRALVASATELISADILDEVVSNSIRTVASEEHRAVTIFLQKQAMDSVTAFIADELIQTVCVGDCAQICHDVFQVDVVKRLENLSNCQKTVELLHMGRVFRTWKARFSAHQRLRKSMETFPPVPSMDDWPSLFSTLVPGSHGLVRDDLHLGGSAFITLKEPQKIFTERAQLSNNISYAKALSSLAQTISRSPLDLVKMITNLRLPQKFTPATKGVNMGLKFYWKLVLALPGVDSQIAEDNILHKWLVTKFRQGTVATSLETDQVKTLCTLSSPLKQGPSVCMYSSVNICVISVSNAIPKDALHEKNHMLGSSGILFVVRHDFLNKAEVLQDERARLYSLLSSRQFRPMIPLAVVYTCRRSRQTKGSVEKYLVDGLDLENLKTNHRIAGFQIFYIDPADIQDPETSKLLEGSVAWIMNSCPKPLQIISHILRDFVEDGLSCKFFNPVVENLKKRLKKGLLHLGPSELIRMYNRVINWLASVASCPRLTELSWPVIEFSIDHHDLPGTNWNSEEQLQMLRNSIHCLALPDFVQFDDDSDDWSIAVADVWTYVQSIRDTERNNSQFLSRIHWLLYKAEQDFKLMCRSVPWSSLDKCPSPLYQNFPWTDFITMCIEYRLDNVLSSQRHIEDLKVFFLPEMVEMFPDLSVSLDVELEMSSDDQTKLSHTVLVASKRKRRAMRDELSLPLRKKFPIQLPEKEESPFLEVFDKQENSLKELSHELDTEKKHSTAFEEYLKNALDLDASVTASSVFPLSCGDFKRPSLFGAVDCKSAGDSLPSVQSGLFVTPCRGDFVDRSSSVSQSDRSKLVAHRRTLSLSEKFNELNASVKSERIANRLLQKHLETSLL